MRSGAAGTHYTSSGTLPMIPGVDGWPATALVYFAADDDVIGTMADKAMVDARRSVVLPTDVERVWTEHEKPEMRTVLVPKES